MGTFQETILIDRPPAAVWNALADIGNIAEWNPGVEKSYTTTEMDGVGASRHCDLGGKNYLDEKVVAWQPNEAITFRITDTNMPFETCDIRFKLYPTGNGKTTVEVSPIYTLKMGVLGTILDAVFVGRIYKNGMRDLLKGLKQHVEAH